MSYPPGLQQVDIILNHCAVKGTGEYQTGTARSQQRNLRLRQSLLQPLVTKEVLFCSIMTIEVGFGKKDSSVPIFMNNIATLNVAGNRAHSGWTKHWTLC